MTRIFLAATSSLFVLAACATPLPAPEAPVEVVETSEVVAPVALTPVEAAMGTVDTLVAAGNTQTAIDRLTQLLGDPDLTPDDSAAILSRRGDLRASAAGYDLMGAISDYQQLLQAYPTSEVATDVRAKLDIANGEATSLNGLLERPETPRGVRFENHFRLGQHNEALDLMLSSSLTPNNDQLIAMYQIGYLCSGDDQTGPAYKATEPDGTPRELRFCDFGK